MTFNLYFFLDILYPKKISKTFFEFQILKVIYLDIDL